MPLPLRLCCISGLGLKGLLHNRTIPVNLPVSSYLGWPLCLGETLPTRNLPSKALRLKCCLYQIPYYVAAPVGETGDVITHLQEPEFFGSQVTCFSGDPSQFNTGSYVLFFEEATCESSTINGLLYAHETLILAWRYDVPWNWLWDACHMAGVRWGSCCEGFCSKEGPHYCLLRSMRNMTINLIHKLVIPWGFHPGLYCIA